METRNTGWTLDPNDFMEKSGRQIAEENGVKTVLTFSDPAMVQFFKPQLQEMISESVVKLNMTIIKQEDSKE